MRAATHLGRFPEVARCVARLRNPKRAMLAYLGLTARYPLDVETRRGTRFRIDSLHDVVTTWIIFCREEYRVEARSRCILDLGANFGAFTLLAAERAPAAKILAIEPYDDEFERLSRHVATNRLEGRVRCVQVAVASDDETRYLSDTASPSQSRAVLTRALAPSGSPVVAARTLGRLLDEAMAHAGTTVVDLVKMDIEGGEHELVTMLTPELLAPVTAWQMEYHPNGPSASIFGALERAGLHLVRRVGSHHDSGIAWFHR